MNEPLVARFSPWRGWLPVFVLPAATILLTPDNWARWLFMWLLAGALFTGLKWLTWRQTRIARVSAWRHAAYLLAWPGLDAAAFLDTKRSVARPTAREWLGAVAKLTAGIALFWGVAPLVPAEYGLLRGGIGMAGVVLMLHFGSFHLLSCGWRAAGVDARPLMQRPLASTSSSEFWGRRWNTAFRDLTHRFLFRPMTARFGATGALAIGFVFSGLIHDLVISVPARAGYGAPTLFFIIQALALFIERSRWGRKLGLGRGWRGWTFTMLMLVLPAPLLFHGPFIREVVLPFMQALGALE